MANQTQNSKQKPSTQTPNGNRQAQPTSKPGGAQRGGIDQDKATAQQPPDADIRKSTER